MIDARGAAICHAAAATSGASTAAHADGWACSLKSTRLRVAVARGGKARQAADEQATARAECAEARMPLTEATRY